jgi:hypothetical protein
MPERDSEEARQGTRLHAALALRLQGAAGDAETLDESEDELVTKAIAFLEGIAAGTPSIQVEVPLRLYKDKRILTTGTADLVASWEKEAVLIDWKFGRAPLNVTAVTFQLAAYAAMLMKTRPHLERVKAYAFQPATMAQYEATFSQGEVTGIIERIRLVIAATETEDAPFVASLEACVYCRALPTCAAAAEFSERGLVESEPKLPIAPERLADLLERASLCQKRIDQVKELATTLAKEGMVIPRHSLVTRRGNAYIAEPMAVFQNEKELCGEKELLNLFDLPFQAFKSLWVEKFAPKTGCSKKDAENAFEKMLGAYIARKADITYLRRTGNGH